MANRNRRGWRLEAVADPGGMAPPLSLEGALSAPEGTLRI